MARFSNYIEILYTVDASACMYRLSHTYTHTNTHTDIYPT